jgi:hypothetical protein
LICIKVGQTAVTNLLADLRGRESSMPVESLVVSIGVVIAFTLFSIVLAWAHHATNGK